MIEVAYSKLLVMKFETFKILYRLTSSYVLVGYVISFIILGDV